MKDVACVTIPGDQVEAVTRTVLAVYGAHAEALGATALAFLDGEDELAEVEHARSELRELEDALADLGWPRPDSAGPVELVGSPRLLRELTRDALLDAATRMVAAVTQYEAGHAELPVLRSAAGAVAVLYGLFEGFEIDHALCDPAS
jgi:hypothetical protein